MIDSATWAWVIFEAPFCFGCSQVDLGSASYLFASRMSLRSDRVCGCLSACGFVSWRDSVISMCVAFGTDYGRDVPDYDPITGGYDRMFRA